MEPMIVFWIPIEEKQSLKLFNGSSGLPKHYIGKPELPLNNFKLCFSSIGIQNPIIGSMSPLEIGTDVLYNITNRRGTYVRNELIKCMKYNNLMDMIYMTNDGHITKRRIRAIQIHGAYFQAYCYLRRSVRTFKYCNMLALVPVIKTERMVV